MKVVLVRHSEVIQEYQGKYNGHVDISLSKKGKKDAIELAKKLKNIKFDKVFCSDLRRAKETLSAFELDLHPIFTKELREKSWGIHEGKSFEEIQKEGIKYISFDQWLSALGGEDVQKYQERVLRYFYQTVFKQKAQNILVVTHAGVIKTLLSAIQNISLEEAFAIELPYSSFLTLDTISL